jgi:hypothetical protein
MAAQNIASEASRNAEIDNSHTESDNQKLSTFIVQTTAQRRWT